MKSIVDMIYESQAKQMRTGMEQVKFKLNLTSIKSEIDIIEENSQFFKIGKTGQTPEERFENYKSDYDEIKPLFSSSVSSVIDDAESELIDNYIDHPKCKNNKDGDSSENDPMKESGEYCVYIVWKN